MFGLTVQSRVSLPGLINQMAGLSGHVRFQVADQLLCQRFQRLHAGVGHMRCQNQIGRVQLKEEVARTAHRPWPRRVRRAGALRPAPPRSRCRRAQLITSAPAGSRAISGTPMRSRVSAVSGHNMTSTSLRASTSPNSVRPARTLAASLRSAIRGVIPKALASAATCPPSAPYPIRPMTDPLSVTGSGGSTKPYVSDACPCPAATARWYLGNCRRSASRSAKTCSGTDTDQSQMLHTATPRSWQAATST